LVAFGLGLWILATGPASSDTTPICGPGTGDPKILLAAARNGRCHAKKHAD
jgi:hypothetical protein